MLTSPTNLPLVYVLVLCCSVGLYIMPKPSGWTAVGRNGTLHPTQHQWGGAQSVFLHTSLFLPNIWAQSDIVLLLCFEACMSTSHTAIFLFFLKFMYVIVDLCIRCQSDSDPMSTTQKVTAQCGCPEIDHVYTSISNWDAVYRATNYCGDDRWGLRPSD